MNIKIYVISQMYFCPFSFLSSLIFFRLKSYYVSQALLDFEFSCLTLTNANETGLCHHTQQRDQLERRYDLEIHKDPVSALFLLTENNLSAPRHNSKMK